MIGNRSPDSRGRTILCHSGWAVEFGVSNQWLPGLGCPMIRKTIYLASASTFETLTHLCALGLPVVQKGIETGQRFSLSVTYLLSTNNRTQ